MKSNMKRIAALVMTVVLVLSMVPGAMAAEYYSGSLSVSGRVKKPTLAPTEAPVEETTAPVLPEEPAEEPVVEEPAVEPTEEPVIEEQVVEPTEEPVIEEPAVEPTEEPVIEEPVAAETKEEETNSLEETVEPETIVYAYEYELNEDGTLKLDENGLPIAIVPDDVKEKPVSFKFDENGNLMLDENGLPIVLATVPVDADMITSIVDELDPNRRIDLYAYWGDTELQFGTEATLIAVLYGYDNAVYTVQWQQSSDNANWSDVSGANELRYSLVVTEDNYLNYWRIIVTVTDVENAQE